MVRIVLSGVPERRKRRHEAVCAFVSKPKKKHLIPFDFIFCNGLNRPTLFENFIVEFFSIVLLFYFIVPNPYNIQLRKSKNTTK